MRRLFVSSFLLLVTFAAICPVHASAGDGFYAGYISRSSRFSSCTVRPSEADSLCYVAGVCGVVSDGKYSPFWFANNSWGRISERPFSTNVFAGISKPAVSHFRWYDYSFAVDVDGAFSFGGVPGGNSGGVGDSGSRNVSGVRSPRSRFLVNDAFAHARLLAFDITAGIRRQQWGLQDSDLSSGGFLFSGNAAAFPRISVGIEEYRPVPFTFGYLEVSGGITHGWMNDRVYVKDYFLHHKFAGIRLGGSLPVNVTYEFHHAAQWGGTHPEYGDLGSSFSDFRKVFFAKAGGDTANDQFNSLGNHIGSQNFAVDVRLYGWKLRGYWQSIFEDGPFRIPWNNQNAPDYLLGFSLGQDSWPFISKVLYEFFRTTDQAGPYHDKDGIVFGGSDSYFSNGIYREGWTYFNRVIGNPLITSPLYNEDGTVFVRNNRVVAHHFGIMGSVFGFRYRSLFTHSRNYGKYSDPESDFKVNDAFLLEVSKTVPAAWGLDFGLSVGVDRGSQFGNCFGVMFTVRKRGRIL